MREDSEAAAAWQALPPIKRIQTWGAVTGNWLIGDAFRELGIALEQWAIEQQKPLTGITHVQEGYKGEKE